MEAITNNHRHIGRPPGIRPGADGLTDRQRLPQDPDTIRLSAGAGPDQIMAYLSQDRIHLLCRRHFPKASISDDYQPVTAEDLGSLGRGFRPGGGGHRCSVCDLDALTG
ncbi:hypothetical protein [Streptomyces sp. NPDC000851]